MGSFKNLTGKRFGRLTVVRRDFPKGKTGTFWLCSCDCGNMKSVSASNLHSGWTKSCGCYKAETSAANFFSHDDTRKNNLRLANNKAEDLTIQKLTRNSETMRKMFEELKNE